MHTHRPNTTAPPRESVVRPPAASFPCQRKRASTPARPMPICSRGQPGGDGAAANAPSSPLNDYKGPLSEFALVVPTPTTLQKGQVRVADKLTFERLDAYSSPRLAEYHDSDPCQMRFDWGYDTMAKQRWLGQAVPAPAAMAARAENSARDKALGVTVEAQYTLEEYDISACRPPVRWLGNLAG
jgi:hypothetical protein